MRWKPIAWVWVIRWRSRREHNEGIADLMREIAEMLPPEPEDAETGEGTRPLKLAIVGTAQCRQIDIAQPARRRGAHDYRAGTGV